MKPWAYYNEHDKKAAAWIRELIRLGEVAPGEVDERSIVDVGADDLRGFCQVHLFAGIGGWSRAFRLAGIRDSDPAWSGSCPCPPFSTAGKNKSCPECGGSDLIACPRRTGYFICLGCEHAWLADARHLWPEMFRLIRDGDPATVFGEQVAGADGILWFAGVRVTLEAIGRAVGASDLAAAGVGAPHRRQRLWWMADSISQRCAAGRGSQPGPEGRRAQPGQTKGGGGQRERGWDDARGDGADAGGPQPVADHDGDGRQQGRSSERPDGNDGALGDVRKPRAVADSRHEPGHGPWRGQETDYITGFPGIGPWDNYAIVHFTTGEARRVESGTQPLVAGLSRGVVYSSDPSAPITPNETAEARQMRLAGYGNSIVAEAAAIFITCCLEAINP